MLLKLLLINLNVFAQISIYDYLNKPAAPLHLQMESDSEYKTVFNIKAEQAAIVTLLGKDSTKYTLQIPANSIPHDAEITMSEIKNHNASVLSPSHGPYGVQLEPSGLEFKIPAKLIIEPAKSIPTHLIVPFSSHKAGEDVSLAMVDISASLNPNKTTIMVTHFSTYSIMGSLTARETIFRAFNQMTADRIQSWFSDQILKSKNGLPHDPDFFQTALDEAFEKVIKERLKNIDSCEGARLAMTEYISWQRQAEILGLDMGISDKIPYARTANSKMAKLCYERAKDACYVEHRPFDVLALALGVSRQAALIDNLSSADVARMEKLAVLCTSFEYEMKSELTIIDDESKPQYSLTAEASGKFMLLNNIFAPPHTDGTIKITDAKMYDMEDCTLSRIDNPESPAIIKTLFMNDLKFDQSLGVHFSIFNPASNAHFECKVDENTTMPISIPGTPEPSEIFGGFFVMLHSQPTANELNLKKGVFEFFKWNVLYKEKFATKEYKRSLPQLGLKEDTSITIFHKPRPL